MSWHGLTDGFSFFPVCLGFKRKVYGGRAGQKLPLYHLSHSFFHMLWYILRQGNVPLDSRKKAFCLFFILSINCTRVNPPTTLYLFCASCEENQSLQDYSRMPYGMGYFSSPTFLHFLLSFWLFFFSHYDNDETCVFYCSSSNEWRYTLPRSLQFYLLRHAECLN